VLNNQEKNKKNLERGKAIERKGEKRKRDLKYKEIRVLYSDKHWLYLKYCNLEMSHC
jgi:hypothetical protein